MKLSLKFGENLSMHGVRHIFNGDGSKFTRFFWGLIILASIASLSFYNYQLYLRLEQTPDINVRQRYKFTSQVPFPAITVCTPLFAKNQLVQFYNVTKMLRMRKFSELNLTVQEQNYLASNIHACYPDVAGILHLFTPNRNRNDVVKLMDESFLSVDDVFMNCGFKRFDEKCTNLFHRVLTDRGFCYSYNLQDLDVIFNKKTISEDFHCYKRPKNEISNVSWSLDRGYFHSKEEASAPEKIIKGKTVGFNIYLSESDTTNLCLGIGNIFSLYLHLPNEIMLPAHQEHYVEFKKKKDIFLTAKSYRADEGMRKFSPKSRGCYFEGEKKLKYFKTYTKALCEFECMTNYTLKTCGCVKFSMPRSSGTPVCTVDKGDCYVQSLTDWPEKQESKDRFEATCGCLKTCNYIEYHVKFEKISTSENIMQVLEINNLTKGAAFSRVSLLFNDFEILEIEEYATYKLHNFVADIGGLLGFFLGCSVLSLIEIIYFIFETCVKKIKCYSGSIDKKDIKNRLSQQSYQETNKLEFVRSLNKISDQRYIDAQLNKIPPFIYRK